MFSTISADQGPVGPKMSLSLDSCCHRCCSRSLVHRLPRRRRRRRISPVEYDSSFRPSITPSAGTLVTYKEGLVCTARLPTVPRLTRYFLSASPHTRID